MKASKAKTTKSSSKETLKAAALFAGIYKSNKFTVDKAHSAFAGVAHKKITVLQSSDDCQNQAALESALDSEKLDSQLFCNQFKECRQSKNEHGSYHFGKDSALFTPAINGDKYILRHVHLEPVLDQRQLGV